jgi:hypothetical protein
MKRTSSIFGAVFVAAIAANASNDSEIARKLDFFRHLDLIQNDALLPAEVKSAAPASAEPPRASKSGVEAKQATPLAKEGKAG